MWHLLVWKAGLGSTHPKYSGLIPVYPVSSLSSLTPASIGDSPFSMIPPGISSSNFEVPN